METENSSVFKLYIFPRVCEKIFFKNKEIKFASIFPLGVPYLRKGFFKVNFIEFGEFQIEKNITFGNFYILSG